MLRVNPFKKRILYIKGRYPSVTWLSVQQLIQANTKEHIKALHYWPFVLGIHWKLGDSPLKGPVMQKMLPCHDIIMYFQVLLPRGCCRIIHYSYVYEDSWRCNFLGLAPGTEMPEHATLFVTLDVEEPTAPPNCDFPPPLIYDLENYSFKINTRMQMPEKGWCFA